mmetsp:Transcript_66483/g.142260  ORF Transcript_66483/g.142260 Transcript_66483/m.142260 type:complete len:127 (+) Transcript_66483:79-459(+)
MGAQCCTQDEANKSAETVAVVDTKKGDAKQEAPREAEVPAGVQFLFQSPDGVQHKMTFTSRPVGMTYVNSVPVVIKSVQPGMQAEKSGVKEKWILLSVNGQDIAGTDFSGATSKIKEALMTLPERS